MLREGKNSNKNLQSNEKHTEGLMLSNAAMERQGGLPHNEGYNHVIRQSGAKGTAIIGGGYMQGISGESMSGYGSNVCLDSQSADDGTKGSNLGAIKFPGACKKFNLYFLSNSAIGLGSMQKTLITGLLGREVYVDDAEFA